MWHPMKKHKRKIGGKQPSLRPHKKKKLKTVNSSLARQPISKALTRKSINFLVLNLDFALSHLGCVYVTFTPYTILTGKF